MRTKRQKKRAEGEVREPRCTRDKCNVCCKSFAAFLFSTVGLVIMVAAYSVAGGFLFRAIEETYEHQSIEAGRADVQNITDQTVMQLWETTRRLNILYPENWTAEAHIVFTRYQRDIYRVVTGSKPLMEWDGGKVGDEIHTKWNFAGALLYAVTAITTIGYGHVTPKTSTGMACTIVYCVFGLPLTLMCVANLGKFFARVFRILYHTCCCGVCCIFCLSCKRRKAASKMTRRPNQNGGVDAAENGQTLIMSNDPNSGVNRPSRKYSFTITKGQIWLQNVKKQFSLSLKDDVTVPVYLCLVVMAIYIFSGALLFALWDGWNYMEGAYFCFVTLTTIGFGDYVPGMIQQNTTDKSSTERLVLCTIYVFLGLALVGMCIDLMQADILQKIAWIGRKIGIAGNSKNAKLNAGATHSTVIQTAEGLPDNKPVIRVQIDQPVSSDVIEYEQETNLAKHNRPMCKTDKPPIVSVHSKGSSKKIKKVSLESKMKDKKTIKASGEPTNAKVKKDVELSEDFLCPPPPAYVEVEEQALSMPSTPASHYDNLSQQTSHTPLHQRLLEVTSHSSEDPVKSVVSPSKSAVPPQGATLHLPENASSAGLSNNNSISLEMVVEASPDLENGREEEILLKVSETPA